MNELRLKALEVQIQALINSWKGEVEERLGKAEPESGGSYDRGYADALDRVVQALQIL